MRIDMNMIHAIAANVRDMLGDDFDDQTFLDTLDGETDAMDIIGGLIREREEAQAHAEACKAEAARYTARKNRLDDRAGAATKALGQVLDAMGERKVTHPLGTVSRTKGRVRLSVYDETAIPSQLTVTTIKPDTAAIKKQLEAGEDVPGAELVTGPDGVMVRIS